MIVYIYFYYIVIIDDSDCSSDSDPAKPIGLAQILSTMVWNHGNGISHEIGLSWNIGTLW